MVGKSTLSNGIRVMTESMPQSLSATIGIWVENGSRYEVAAENGVSHFIEHLLFKGTSKRTAAQIAEEMDAVGGVLNAFTGKEYTCYYAKVLGEDLTMATDLLADLFLDSTFAGEEVDRELMTSFMKDRYRAHRVFIAASGQLEHEKLVAHCERLFSGIAGDGHPLPFTSPTDRPVMLTHHKKLEQAHLVIGGPGIGQSHPLRYASYVMNTALGGGMSSRLFQEVREKRGRVYSIYSFMSSYLDCGYFAVYAGTNPEWVDEVIEVTLTELKKVAIGGLTANELARAKSQLKGNMLLGMESTDSRMHRLARNEIYFGRDIPIEEVAKGIEQVSNDQIIELASSFFKADSMGLVVLGDLKGRTLGTESLSPL